MIDLKESLKSFFTSYLLEQKQVSPHTIKSYRDTFRLLFEFIQRRKGAKHTLSIADFDIPVLLDFLKSLEDPKEGRGNSVNTRNHRLTAIHSFFRYLSWQYPSAERQAERIRAIPFKKPCLVKMDYLTHDELKVLLSQVDLSGPDGFRDLSILTFLYNSGARSQEVADARISWFDFSNHVVQITGKGNKPRSVPLWDTTVKAIQTYVKNHRRRPKVPGQDILFINQRGMTFSRFGIWCIVNKYARKAKGKCESLRSKRISTHSMRHTTAMHLLESGVDLNVLKGWLGHTSIETTSAYLHDDIARKKRALDKFGPPIYVESSLEEKPSGTASQILDWLDSF